MISVRFDSDIERHAGNAALAAATAAPTSSTEAKSTWRVSCPVAGSYTGPSRPDVPATNRPPIQWLTRPGAPGSVVAVPGSATCVIGTPSSAVEGPRYSSRLADGPAGTVRT